MKYDLFKKARAFGKDEKNKKLIEKVDSCEDILAAAKWMKENRDTGKPRYSCDVTISVRNHDGTDKEVVSVTYPTNFDWVEEKAGKLHDLLIKEFETKMGE